MSENEVEVLRGRILRELGDVDTYSTAELREQFDVLAFSHGVCSVRRRSDGVRGTLEFTHRPRLYYRFIAG